MEIIIMLNKYTEMMFERDFYFLPAFHSLLFSQQFLPLIGGLQIVGFAKDNILSTTKINSGSISVVRKNALVCGAVSKYH
jgi:hypothetical protein